MKLIDYVINNEKDIDAYEMAAGFHEIDIKDYITTGYCPSAFDSICGTNFEKPYVASRTNKNDCKFLGGNNEEKCSECWNREILVLMKL
jgi:hypothetical protein